MTFKKPLRVVPIKLGELYRRKAKKERLGRVLWPLGLLLGAAGIGGAVGVASTVFPASTSSNGDRVTGCRVVDGDTLRCGNERVRLLGIDAPELAGHCQPGRRCAPGDGNASTASLRRAIEWSMAIERVGQDRYGRTLALVRSSKGDLSCWQVRSGQALYRANWDDGGRLAATCR
jgi:endonuclease YncB( thermonuclease family)